MFSSSTWSKATLWKPLAQQYRDSGWLRGWQDLSFDPKLLREADAFEVQSQWRGCWVTCLLLLLRSKSIKVWFDHCKPLKPGSHLTTPRTLTWMPPYQQAGKQLWTHLAWQMVRRRYRKANYLWNMRENHPYMLYYNPSSNLLWNKKPNQKRHEKPSLTSFWHITPAICII